MAVIVCGKEGGNVVVINKLPMDIFHKVEFYPWVKVMVCLIMDLSQSEAQMGAHLLKRNDETMLMMEGSTFVRDDKLLFKMENTLLYKWFSDNAHDIFFYLFMW
jgi:hypothetical protein